jgi:hypothetical protein
LKTDPLFFFETCGMQEDPIKIQKFCLIHLFHNQKLEENTVRVQQYPDP